MGAHDIFISKNWSSSDPDPKLIIIDTDPGPAFTDNFGFDRVHNTGSPDPVLLFIEPKGRKNIYDWI